MISLKGFFQECFSHKIFILLYLSGAAWVLQGARARSSIFLQIPSELRMSIRLYQRCGTGVSLS